MNDVLTWEIQNAHSERVPLVFRYSSLDDNLTQKLVIIEKKNEQLF